MATLRTEHLKKAGNVYISPSRIYLDSERKKALAHGHPEAAFLLAAEGDEISQKDAEKFGLLENDPEPVPEAEEMKKLHEKKAENKGNVTLIPSPEKIEKRETRVPKDLETR